MENNYSFILEDNIERRRMNDKPLVNFFLLSILYMVSVGFAFIESLALLNAIFSFGITSTMIYLQTNRVNAFIERKTEWYTKVVEFTNKHSEDSRNLKKLNNLIDPEIFTTHMKTINLNNPLIFLGISSILVTMTIIVGEEPKAAIFLINMCIIGVGVAIIIVYEYPMNAIWNKIQCFENEFDSTLSKVWIDNGWIEKPIEFYIDFNKNRDYFLWFFYSIVSLGVMLIVWKYRVYTDPDFMYYRFHEKEDQILDVIEKIEQQKKSEVEN